MLSPGGALSFMYAPHEHAPPLTASCVTHPGFLRGADIKDDLGATREVVAQVVLLAYRCSVHMQR